MRRIPIRKMGKEELRELRAGSREQCVGDLELHLKYSFEGCRNTARRLGFSLAGFH